MEGIPIEFFIPSQTDVVGFATDAGVISVRRKEDADVAYHLYKDCGSAIE